MNEQPISDWFASLYQQSESTVALVLDAVRRNGESVGEYVVVVAELRDEATRFFVDQLTTTDPSVPGYVGAFPKSEVARVLRVIDAGTFADATLDPVAEGTVRLLVAARGLLQCADIPCPPPLSRGGMA